MEVEATSNRVMLRKGTLDLGRAVIAQKTREVLGYRPSVFHRCYDRQEVIFIHIPKCAGTAVASQLYGQSCWHWTARELRFISPRKFETYYKFSVVRNPWDRLFSIYRYAPLDTARFKRSPLEFISCYRTFEEFVSRGLSSALIAEVRFLWPQYRYLEIDGQMAVDAVGRFEELDSFIAGQAEQVEALRKGICKMNVSPWLGMTPGVYTSKMVDKVAALYQDDIKYFGYTF